MIPQPAASRMDGTVLGLNPCSDADTNLGIKRAGVRLDELTSADAPRYEGTFLPPISMKPISAFWS